MTPDEEEFDAPAEFPVAPRRTFLGALGWALAGAACAATSYATGLAITSLTMGVNASTDALYSPAGEAVLRAVASGASFGMVVGMFAGGLVAARGRIRALSGKV